MPHVRLPLHRAAIATAAFAALFASQASWAADATRGQALYDERCTGCHGQSVHDRPKRVARDFEAVRGWVKRWSDTLKTAWSEPDVEDVTMWLNATYYNYPCPPTTCKVLSQVTRSASR